MKKNSRLPEPPDGRIGWPWTHPDTPSIDFNKSDCPKICLITPSFNQAKFIEETIRSVLLQGYPKLQYIVIDGGSTDGTLQILQKYDPWIDYWISEPDEGQSDAINKGLALADGEWFNWINSDDYLLPGALHRLIEERTTDTHIISGATWNVRDGIEVSRYTASVALELPEAAFSLRVNQPGSLLSLAAVRTVGGIRKELEMVMDLDLWIRILLKYGTRSFRDIAVPVAAYRYHEASKTCSGEDPFALEEFAILTDLFTCLTGNIVPPTIAGIRRRSGVPTVEFKGDEGIDSRMAFRSYFDRLIVSDALLFRAVQSAAVDGNQNWIIDTFLTALKELRRELAGKKIADMRKIESQAIVHALHRLGSFDVKLVAAALLRDPTLCTVGELLRHAARVQLRR